MVAAFDNAEEYHAEIQKRAEQLRGRRERGDEVDRAERIGGRMYEPDHRRLQRNAHLLKRAIEHGASPAGVEELELPPNVGVVRAVGPADNPDDEGAGGI